MASLKMPDKFLDRKWPVSTNALHCNVWGQLYRWPCHWLTDWVTESLSHFCFLTLKSDPRDQWPLRHLITVMRKHDLTNILTIVDNFFNFLLFFTIFDNFCNFLTILTTFDNFYNFLTILTIFDNSDNFWQCLTIFDNVWQFLTILTIFDNFWQFWQF